MKYAILFPVLGAVLLYRGAASGGALWMLAWPGVSLVLVGLAYAGVGPRLFGKRPDGRLPSWSLVLHFPYLSLTYLTWRACRAFSSEPATADLDTGIVIGRRLLPGEMPAGVDCVVDLTCEFPEPRGVMAGRRYVSFPLLDASAPTDQPFVEWVKSLTGIAGKLFIHCAQGHGRTGLVAAALLAARGQADSADEALRKVRDVRPGVRLSGAQRAALDEVVRQLRG